MDEWVGGWMGGWMERMDGWHTCMHGSMENKEVDRRSKWWMWIREGRENAQKCQPNILT